ncbi:hypothetical protein HMPREF0183_1726 [Brevibacterium mcbrellneri ATCC 49030]|uniref:Uncharacterized protein n=1 Tax=Brevibacterium mcbrellneri ATCC 49030 TaxID=585530 RepID=D4YP66_9MICO|nr:hypothetical protein HMPREF0183_1726 [Brevibacterium mcbrellneri ATCC 49030]
MFRKFSFVGLNQFFRMNFGRLEVERVLFTGQVQANILPNFLRCFQLERKRGKYPVPQL